MKRSTPNTAASAASMVIRADSEELPGMSAEEFPEETFGSGPGPVISFELVVVKLIIWCKFRVYLGMCSWPRCFLVMENI
jgi:hypothetical protein